MKNTKKTTSKRISGFALAAVALFVGVGGYLVSRSLPADTPVTVDPGLGNGTIITNGMKIRYLSETTNTDGSVTKVYSYTVTPVNADIQSASAVAKYIDDTDPSAVLTASIDKTEQTISVTCLRAFSKQIVVYVDVTAMDNSTASGTITFDYVKKILGLEATADHDTNCYYVGNGWSAAKNGLISSLAIEEFIMPSYSVYTKDKDYTFSTSVMAVQYCDETVIEDYKEYSISDATIALLQEALEVKMKLGNAAYFTPTELWNIDSSNSWHSFLMHVKDADPELNYINFCFYTDFYCDQNHSVKIAEQEYYICLSFAGDYSGLSVGVDSMTLEATTGEF